MVQIVKEFYANAKDHHKYDVRVRGEVVTFHNKAINRYYNLSVVKKNEYVEYVRTGPNYKLIIQQLCQPGTELRVKEKAAMHFLLSKMSRYGKAWFAFICAKLMSSTNINDVTKEMVVLLY